MSAVSAIGLQLCPMATNEKCLNESDVTTALSANPTPAYLSSLDSTKAEKEFQVNFYVSADIHHNNITVNSDNGINIDTKLASNFTTTASQHSVWQKLFPKHFEFLRSLMNGSFDAEQTNSDIVEELPQNDFLKTEINNTMNAASDDDRNVDPCSHPEYIVFTWVSINHIHLFKRV